MPERGSEIHLVVDGPLGRLPFAALVVDGRPLVQDYVITYVPSLSALAAIDQDSKEARDAPVVLGDPLGDLAYAALESREVSRRLGVAPALGSDASLQALAGSARSEILHLATHTGLGPRAPGLRSLEETSRVASW